MVSFRQQAEAAANVLQAESTSAAPAVARRATADMATQYMLGDLDSEPVSARAHELHGARTAANARGLVNNSSVESAGLLGAASAAEHRHAPQGLIQAHDHPVGGVDRPSRQAESGMLTKQALPVVHHSDLEGAVTEDEASLKQAEVTALLGIDRPHAPSWDNSGPARQHWQAAGHSQAKHGVNADDVSISVTAGGQEYVPADTPASWVDMHLSRASAKHSGPGGTAPRAAVGAAGGQSPYDIRSPLQSTHEEHGIRSGSLRPSSAGRYHLDSCDEVAPACCIVLHPCETPVTLCMPPLGSPFAAPHTCHITLSPKLHVSVTLCHEHFSTD